MCPNSYPVDSVSYAPHVPYNAQMFCAGIAPEMPFATCASYDPLNMNSSIYGNGIDLASSYTTGVGGYATGAVTGGIYGDGFDGGYGGYAYDPELNKDPGKCFFNGMVMRVLRALEYLKTLPEWNKKDVIASGNSQGGLQTMWAAALDQDVTLASPAVTWCCDMAGAVKAGRLPGVFPIAYQPALDYYDPVFMAKRITQAEVIIRRGGLGDYVCPPSGVAISYKNLSTLRKRIYWHQGSDHGFIPDMPEIITWKTNK